MLQFNLLPDVKKEYIKAKRQKRLIVSFSTLAAGAALAVTVILFTFVQVGQKGHIKGLTEDIDSTVNSINSIEDLDKILTIQSQLETIPELHAAKPESSRIFNYLVQLTPSDVKIRAVAVDFQNATITLEGIAPDLATINRFADTIKFSKYKAVAVVDPDDSEAEQADINEAEEIVPFTNVLTELSRSEELSSYEISFTYDPEIFNNSMTVQLIIPSIVTTRSTQGKPDISDQADNPLFDTSGDGDQ